jgi:hypothetical protein
VLRIASARVRLAVQRLDTHALHQRAHAPAANLVSLATQQARQHPRSRKRKLHVQSIDPAHQQLVCLAHRLRLVVHARSCDTNESRLLRDRQCVRTIDHRFALSNPALLSAPL